MPSMVLRWFLMLLPSLSMVFDGSGPLVKRCDGFDGSLWSSDCHSKCNVRSTLSHSLLAASPSGRMPHSSLITCTWFTKIYSMYFHIFTFTKIHSMYFLLNFFSSLGGGDSKLSYKATFPRSSQSR